METSIDNILTKIKVLRSNVSSIFVATSENHNVRDEQTFLSELQEGINSVSSNFKDLENSINALNVPSGPFNLGNTAFLNYETDLERQNMYNELINGYKWYEKTHQYSGIASTMLQHNTLKRSYFASSNKRRRVIPGPHTASPKLVDQTISTFNVNNMTLKIYRPFAQNAFVHINLGRVLKAAIILRGLMIEWVIVKGFNESLENVDDHWHESRYAVFRKVQEHAHSAMLHFYSPTFAELAIRSFITWFGSYSTLFNEPCKKCGKHLLNSLPPTYRDVRSLEPTHEECKN